MLELLLLRWVLARWRKYWVGEMMLEDSRDPSGENEKGRAGTREMPRKRRKEKANDFLLEIASLKK